MRSQKHRFQYAKTPEWRRWIVGTSAIALLLLGSPVIGYYGAEQLGLLDTATTGSSTGEASVQACTLPNSALASDPY